MFIIIRIIYVRILIGFYKSFRLKDLLKGLCSLFIKYLKDSVRVIIILKISIVLVGLI